MELQAPLQPGRRSSRPRWPPSPHGRERRGGWLKRRLTQEVESGRCIFDSLDELDEFLAQITAAKNRWWNQRGHSPVQLVFGELPRVSAELLSDGPGGLQPLADSLHDPAGGDEVGVEFRRRMAIRDWARQLAMENDSKEAIQKAIKTTTRLSSSYIKVSRSPPTRELAIDVAREGPPPGSGDEQAPVEQVVADGLAVDEPQAARRAESTLPPGEMPGAPENFLPVPPGLVGPQGAPPPVEEPAQEPTQLDPIAEESSPGGTAEEQEPPRKASRTDEGTRAPGTPIHQLLRVIRSRRDQPESSRPSEASPREASRSPRREDPDHGLLTWFSLNDEGELNFLAKRNDEISLKDLNEAEAKMFEESDAIEWKAILNSKAVRVIHGAEAEAGRKKWGDRILSSRMVRRKKPLPEDNRWKAKSRWCVGGHKDPDTGTLTTYAPTPQGEGMMAFIQTSLNLKHSFAFTDVKNAFCQSDKIRREVPDPVLQGCRLCTRASALGRARRWRVVMSAFAVEQMHLRLRARASAASEPYPLDLPVPGQLPPPPLVLNVSGENEARPRSEGGAVPFPPEPPVPGSLGDFASDDLDLVTPWTLLQTVREVPQDTLTVASYDPPSPSYVPSDEREHAFSDDGERAWYSPVAAEPEPKDCRVDLEPSRSSVVYRIPCRVISLVCSCSQRCFSRLLEGGHATQLGLSLLQKTMALKDDDDIRQSLSDAFRGKASATLQKRALSLQALAAKHLEMHEGSPWRMTEVQGLEKLMMSGIDDWLKVLGEGPGAILFAQEWLAARSREGLEFQAGDFLQATLITWTTWCSKFGLAPELLRKMIEAGFDTFGRVAFAAGANPMTLTDGAVDEWISTFEVRKLPVAERLVRQEEQAKRLTGLQLTPHNMPGHACVDEVVSMIENNTLKYLPMNRWISRSQELALRKNDPAVSLDNEGNIRISGKTPDLTCDTPGLYALRQAFQRRALAFDLGHLATFGCMEAWTNDIFERTQRTPPKGYAAVSIGQLISADREMFVQAAHRLEGKLQGAPSGTRPLDGVLKELSVSHEVIQYLLPLAAASATPNHPPPPKKVQVDPPPPPPEDATFRDPRGGGKLKKPRKDKIQIVVPNGCAARDGQGICNKHFAIWFLPKVLNEYMTASPSELALKRRLALLKVKLLVRSLEKEEEELHASFPSWYQKVVAPKKILAWKRLLEEFKHDDLDATKFMMEGCPLVGTSDLPQPFDAKIVPATLTEQELRATAKARRQTLVQTVRPGDAEHVEHLVRSTLDEVDRGFLDGPFTESEVSERLGHADWTAVRRFVLVQGAEMKLRPIDDCAEAQLNDAYTSTIKLRMMDSDYISALALKIAHLEAERAARLGKTQFFIGNALVFGATSAVFSVNRVARSLWFLVTKLMHLPCGYFYNDYPIFGLEEEGELVDQCVSEFLSLLGWEHATSGSKGLAFDKVFTVLGMSLDLSQIQSQVVILANKPGRAERISQKLGEIATAGRINRHEAQVLRGLLQFASGFYAGRGLKQTCCWLGEVVKGVSFSPEQVRERCEQARCIIASSSPRFLRVSPSEPLLHLYTDGSWEGNVAGIGAVLFDAGTNRGRVFQGFVDPWLVKTWLSSVGEQLICEIELYALVAIRHVLGSTFEGTWWSHACWLMKFEYDADGKAVSQILLEVDDFIVTALPSHEKQVEEELRRRFTFGKWEKGAAEYGGRRVRTFHDKVLIDQGKYIREQVRPVPLEKNRKQDRNALLNETEFQLLRSAIYKVNWLAKESRPEMAGLASIMASRLSAATIDDVLTVNKCINRLRNTADRALTIWRFDPKEMAFVVVTDAGGISIREGEEDADGLPMDATQGAWAVIATEHLPVGRERVKGSILAWRSSKLKRKVFSSFGGEAQAMLQGVNEVDWLQVMIRDATVIYMNDSSNAPSPMRNPCSIAFLKNIHKDLQDTQSMVRWTPHQKNIVDGLTKSDPLKSN
ncbi:unnamed protein product, partial [Symbiodinium sp. KB8]